MGLRRACFIAGFAMISVALSDDNSRYSSSVLRKAACVIRLRSSSGGAGTSVATGTPETSKQQQRWVPDSFGQTYPVAALEDARIQELFPEYKGGGFRFWSEHVNESLLRGDAEKAKLFNSFTLTHGARSSSLLAFTEYGAFEGVIKPKEALLAEGKVPFAGELAIHNSERGVNKHAVSTTILPFYTKALEYSRIPSWKPDGAKSPYEPGTAMSRKSPELDSARQAAFQSFSDLEKSLITQDFPVLFGIRPSVPENLARVHSSVAGEVAVVGGVKGEEIKVVFVPKDKIDLVKSIFLRASFPHIRVEEIESLPDIKR